MKNWDEQIEFPKKDPWIDYAYVLKAHDNLVSCTKNELSENIEYNEDVKFVTTPEHETFILPGEDFETLKPLIRKRKRSIIRNLYVDLSIILAYSLMMYFDSLSSGAGFWSDRFNKLMLLAVGIIPAIFKIFEIFKLSRLNENNFQDEALKIKFDFWINQKRPLSIYVFTGILVVIALFQIYYGLSESIAIAGLDKSETLGGEYWRLLTCTLLHGGIFHILLNGAVTFGLGQIVVRISGFSYFVIVFLFSGVMGSIFSLILIPDQTSVGSSGAIMGLIGFILVFGLKKRDNVPRELISSMTISIIMIALLGLFAYDIIDNAAHAGGLIGGIFLGSLLIKRKQLYVPINPSLLVNICGILATLVLFSGVVFVLIKFYVATPTSFL